MFTFLLEEGVVTVGTISGLFTTAMLVSFKNNIMEPVIENIFPNHTLDVDKSSFYIDFDATKNEKANEIKKIKWQTFVRDFCAWIFVMTLLYLFWKFVLHKYKKP